jgi:Nif-specific regulatory protein
LQRVLEILGRHHGAIRSTVVLLNEETQDIELEAAAGAIDPGRRIRFRKGEGITGQVLQSGKPIVVPQVSREPAFLNRMSARPELARGELTYISVPISLDNQTVGALAIDLHFKPDRDYQRMVKFLGVAGSMIAHAVRVHRLIEADRQNLLAENSHLRAELKQRYDFSNIIGTSGPMRQVYEQAAQVARTNTTVILRGESGTGKELFANAIHYNSSRAKRPLIKVSCSALPHDLIESELFGYEKGAFTDAQASKKGRFELAEGGTLFLDEIGELNLSTQVKLLRVLQEREFERLGGVTTIPTDIRLIVATNKDLEKGIAEGTFREDLYYRLNVFALFVPPLRERRPDILLLADHFLEKFSHQLGKHVKRISTPAIDMLMSYHWPGNVRELENAIERAVVLTTGPAINARAISVGAAVTPQATGVPSLKLRQNIEWVERETIRRAIESAGGVKKDAAELMGISQRALSYYLAKYRLDS